MDPQPWRNRTAAPDEPRAAAAFLLFDCAVLTFTLVLGLPGNLWICWVASRTKSLRTCNNALLVSLAASDLLKCSVDAPLLLLVSVLRRGPGPGPVTRTVPGPVCALQQFTFALCSCVQLLTLVSISVERYRAIAFPFRTEGRRVRVRLWILSIWACGLALAALSLALSQEALLHALCRTHGGGDGREHPRRSDPFGPYVLVPVWGLSLALILVHYARIFRVVRQQRRKLLNRGVQLRPTVSEHVWAWLSVSGSPAALAGPPRRSALPMAAAGAGPGSAPGRRPLEIVGAVCLLTPGARERGKKQVEGKVAQRFGYIMVGFTLFWLPMVVVLLMKANSRQDTDRLLRELETSAMVLTCMQAAVDPLIYTLVTRQFRSELSKILSSIPGCPLKD